MLGNVWEWCSDRYWPYSSGTATNPTGASSGSARVHRGGSWYHYARYCRSANRGRGNPGGRDRHLGFRVALAPVQ